MMNYFSESLPQQILLYYGTICSLKCSNQAGLPNRQPLVPDLNEFFPSKYIMYRSYFFSELHKTG